MSAPDFTAPDLPSYDDPSLKEPNLLKRHLKGRAPLIAGLVAMGVVLLVAIVALAGTGTEEVKLPPTAEEVQAVVASMSN